MNAYERAQQLGLTGTIPDIVEQLKPITASMIDLTELMQLLNFRNMLRKTDGTQGTERWQGTLCNMKAALVAANATQLLALYEMWFSFVTNPRQQKWDTTVPQYAAAFSALESQFANQPGMPTSDDFGAVAALGGGRPFWSLTTAQYEQQKSDAENSIAIESALTTVRAKLDRVDDAARIEARRSGATPQTINAVAQAAWEV